MSHKLQARSALTDAPAAAFAERLPQDDPLWKTELNRARISVKAILRALERGRSLPEKASPLSSSECSKAAGHCEGRKWRRWPRGGERQRRHGLADVLCSKHEALRRQKSQSSRVYAALWTGFSPRRRDEKQGASVTVCGSSEHAFDHPPPRDCEVHAWWVHTGQGVNLDLESDGTVPLATTRTRN